MSETKSHGENLKAYCKGYGIDVGYGGDPIIPTAITVDLPMPYTKVGSHPLNLGGDAKNLFWFNDDVLDYVYSSHCLEDFENTRDVLVEWTRVIRQGGKLVLLLPDQQRYEAACESIGISPNAEHKIKTFGLKYLKDTISSIPNLKIIFEQDLIGKYNFQIVVEKIHKSGIGKYDINYVDKVVDAYRKLMKNPICKFIRYIHKGVALKK